MSPRFTAAEIREAYPDAKKDSGAGNYCVGGACCIYMIKQAITNNALFQEMLSRGISAGTMSLYVCPNGEAFPGEGMLKLFLEAANNDLPDRLSTSFAKTIIANNDSGCFEAAWDLLRDALDWRDLTNPGVLLTMEGEAP